jgi:hypothetical protein
LGIGDWGLGIGDWGLGPIPNPQSPSPIPNLNSQIYLKLIFILNKIKLNDKKFNIILSIINEQKNS